MIAFDNLMFTICWILSIKI